MSSKVFHTRTPSWYILFQQTNKAISNTGADCCTKFLDWGLDFIFFFCNCSGILRAAVLRVCKDVLPSCNCVHEEFWEIYKWICWKEVRTEWIFLTAVQYWGCWLQSWLEGLLQWQPIMIASNPTAEETGHGRLPLQKGFCLSPCNNREVCRDVGSCKI